MNLAESARAGPMDTMKQQLLARLLPYGQEHLVAFWEQLDLAARQRLARQIEEIDFELVARCFQGGDGGPDWAELGFDLWN